MNLKRALIVFKAIKCLVKTLKHADNEITQSPYWLIIDPHQMMRPDIGTVAHMVTGPFFCREDAEDFMKNVRPHAFSGRARVYCLSGCWSWKYDEVCTSLRIGYDD